jgi:transcriptional regulator with XRE-family HTH domain
MAIALTAAETPRFFEIVHTVRKRARTRCLSVERLADFAGVSHRTVWNTLAGEHFPTLKTLCALSRALDCRPSALLP